MKKTMKIFLLAALVICTIIAMATVVSATEGDVTVLGEGLVTTYTTYDPDDSSKNVLNDGSVNDIRWKVTSDGVLTFTGTHNILWTNPAISWDAKGNCPWQKFTGSITKVVVEAPVTTIKDYIFSYLTNVETIVLPDHEIKFTGHNHFASCSNLKTVGPEGTATGIIDMRNFIGDGKQMFENTFEKSGPVTFLLHYKNAVEFLGGHLGNKDADITFKVAAGSPGETRANAIVAAEAANPDNTSPTIANTLAVVNYAEGEYAVSGDISGNADDENDLKWTFDFISETLSIDGTSTTLNWAEGIIVGWTSTGTDWSGLPWYDYRTLVKHVKVNAPITKLGEQCVFSCLSYMESIELPATLTNLGSMTFKDAHNLTTLKTTGVEAPDGVIDLRNFSSSSQSFEDAFKYVTAEIWLGTQSARTLDNVFGNAYGPGVNFVVYPGTANYVDAVTKSNYAVDADNRVHPKGKITYSYYTEEQCKEYYDEFTALLNNKYVGNYSAFGWNLDLETGLVDIYPVVGNNAGWNQVELDSGNFPAFKSTWKYHIKAVVLRNYTTEEKEAAADSPLRNFDQWYGTLSDLPELTKIVTTTTRMGSTARFKNNPKLTTFGTVSNVEDGVVNLSNIYWDGAKLAGEGTDGVVDTDVEKSYNFTDNFSGCSGITKVILPAGGANPIIGANVFNGCTSLAEVVVLDGSQFTAIDATAFAGCNALAVDVQDVDFIGTNFTDEATFEAAFPAGSTFTYAESEPEPEPEPDPVELNKALVLDGFKVRVNGYNGLRSIFYKDNTVTNEGWTLYEYGTLVTPSANKANAVVTFDGTNATTAVTQVTIKSGDNYEGKILQTGDDIDPDKNAEYFAISVVRYSKNWATELYFRGYEIWTKDGEYQILYTEYAGNANYVDVSLYEVTLGMYKAGRLNAEDDVDGLLWNTLVNGGAVTLAEGTDYTVDEGTTLMDGTAFGDTFRAVEVQMVDSYREPTDDSGKNFVADGALTFENTGVTYTLLSDTETDGYVIVYRVDENAANQREDGEKWLPRSRYWNEGFQSQLKNAWLAGRVPTTVTIPTARPNPTFVDANVFNKITYAIVDHGVTGTEHEAFDELPITGLVYPSTLTFVDKAMIQDCKNLTKVFMKGTTVKDGVADLRGVKNLVAGYTFNGVTSMTTAYLPEGVTTLEKQFSTQMVETIYIPDSCSTIVGNYAPKTDTTSKIDDFAFGSRTTITLIQTTYNAELVASMESYVAEAAEKGIEFTFVYLDANGAAHVAP